MSVSRTTTSMDKLAGSAWYMPWAMLAVLPVFAYTTPRVSGIQLSLPYLFLPVAAWLGYRYRRSGVAVVAIGAVFGLVAFRSNIGQLGGFAGDYLVAVAASILAARLPADAPFGKPLSAGAGWAASFAVALLLPLSWILYGERFDSGLEVSFRLSLWSPLYFAMFVLGARDVRWRAVAGALLTGIVVAWAVEFSGALAAFNDLAKRAVSDLGSGFKSIRGGYGLFQIVSLVSALAFFSAGRTVCRIAAGREARAPFWGLSYLAIALAILFWASPVAYEIRPIRLPWGHARLYLTGAYQLLALASFMAGYLLKWRGVALCLGLIVALIATELAIVLLTESSRDPYVQLEWLMMPIAFGWLGMRLGDPAMDLHVRTTFRWGSYVALVVAIEGTLFAAGEPNVAFAVIAVAALLGYAGHWLRRRSIGTPYEISPRGWAGLCYAIALAPIPVSEPRTVLGAVETFSVLLGFGRIPGANEMMVDEVGLLIMFATAVASLYVVATLIVSLWTVPPQIVRIYRLLRLSLRQ